MRQRIAPAIRSEHKNEGTLMDMATQIRTGLIIGLSVVGFVVASMFMLMNCMGTRQDPIDTLVINETSRTLKINVDAFTSVSIAPGKQYLWEHSANNNRYGGYYRIYAEDDSVLAEIEKSGAEFDSHLVDGHLYVLRVTEDDLRAAQAEVQPGEKPNQGSSENE